MYVDDIGYPGILHSENRSHLPGILDVFHLHVTPDFRGFEL